MKLTITRTWAPVTKTVESCDMCPWFAREREHGVGTLPVCENPKYPGKGGYDSVLGDETLISDLCPERPKSQKLFVGDSDHEPDKEWVQDV